MKKYYRGADISKGIHLAIPKNDCATQLPLTDGEFAYHSGDYKLYYSVKDTDIPFNAAAGDIGLSSAGLYWKLASSSAYTLSRVDTATITHTLSNNSTGQSITSNVRTTKELTSTVDGIQIQDSFYDSIVLPAGANVITSSLLTDNLVSAVTVRDPANNKLKVYTKLPPLHTCASSTYTTTSLIINPTTKNYEYSKIREERGCRLIQNPFDTINLDTDYVLLIGNNLPIPNNINTITIPPGQSCKRNMLVIKAYEFNNTGATPFPIINGSFCINAGVTYSTLQDALIAKRGYDIVLGEAFPIVWSATIGCWVLI